MAMEMKLQMRLSQQLIMTPQLQQAIKLLQLSRTELEELIDQSLIENPVLEDGIDIDSNPETDGETYSQDESPELFEGPEEFENVKEIQKDTRQEEMDWQEFMEFGTRPAESKKASTNDELPSLEATVAQGTSLADHLLWQLDMLKLEPLEHRVGVHLIGNIEGDGYLTVSIRELLENNPDLREDLEKWLSENEFKTDLEYDPLISELRYKEDTTDKKSKSRKTSQQEQIEKSTSDYLSPFSTKLILFIEQILRKIQLFDPNGVGARNLKECLLIQLKVLNMENDLSYRIIQNDMELLESKDLKKIARRQKAELEKVIEAYRLIMSLEPKPGRIFSQSGTHQYIIPDVYIYKSTNDEYKVALNEQGIPRLRISGYYKNLAQNMEDDGNLTKDYIQEKIKSGQWLMRSIEQRQKTIYRVTQSILKFQKEFFEKGIHFLKPLVLKDVAEDIGVHESTVSRITTNKYAHTPQGIFELKYFFTSGIDQDEGEAVSSKLIKDLIEQLIQSENLKSPYTDLQIADILLKKNNIRVARRTVAKYREALNILPSNKRKQLF